MELKLKDKPVFEYTLSELRELMREEGIEPFRANQVFDWVYKKRQLDTTKYSNISPELREKLRALVYPRMSILDIYNSNDGSSKFLLKLPEGDVIETVLMRHVKNGERRYTVCLSTQLGCPVGCAFCASGKYFNRSLSAGEIVEQLWHVQRYLDETEGVRVSNLVYMGMGEPLLNLDATLKSLEIFSHDAGFNISTRNITVSTVGIPEGIRKLADSGLRVKLALSLHSPREEIRRKLIPIARRFPLSEILDALLYFWNRTRRRITIEYIMIRDLTDTPEDAEEIVRLLKDKFKGVRLLINLIPYNYVEGLSFQPSTPERIDRFAGILAKHFDVTVRRSMGDDIKAACGQLRYKRLREDKLGPF